MVGQKKKYSSGEGAAFLTRNQALRKLQLSLKDFRKLCILKGIYPREPSHRSVAQHRNMSIKTLYAKKDIQFLMHEPMIWTVREQKTHARKIIRARSLREFKEVKRLKNIYPEVKLDHIIKERYPTFVSALKDLDDCLTMCFLFSTFPMVKLLPKEQPAICRRLTFEFLHAVIASQALRKVFVSIKGYYFQAEIKGQTITWIMPHTFSFKPQSKYEVDFKIMTTFVEFYTVLLGFVNYKLYHDLNLFYPPKLSVYEKHISDIVERNAFVQENIATLNVPLARTVGTQESVDDEVEIDIFDDGTDESARMKAKQEAENVKKLKTLFKGLRVFLNREVPRLPLIFTLKSFGAEVSWDKTVSIGATFDESDETITHQIVDRPLIDKQFISRYYIQPQWVFDSVNAKRLLPVEKYFLGVDLPPHLSPFVDVESYGEDNYIPPEQLKLISQDDSVEQDVKEVGNENTSAKKKSRKKGVAGTDENKSETKTIEENSESLEEKRERMKSKMNVRAGKANKPNVVMMKAAEVEQLKLRERMIPRKYKTLYSRMMKAKAERKKDKNVLTNKRLTIEKQKRNKSVL